MKVVFNISEKCIKEIAIATGEVKSKLQKVEVNLSNFTQKERAVLLANSVIIEGFVFVKKGQNFYESDYTRRGELYFLGFPTFENCTVEGIIKDLIAVEEKKKEEEEKKKEEEEKKKEETSAFYYNNEENVRKRIASYPTTPLELNDQAREYFKSVEDIVNAEKEEKEKKKEDIITKKLQKDEERLTAWLDTRASELLKARISGGFCYEELLKKEWAEYILDRDFIFYSDFDGEQCCEPSLEEMGYLDSLMNGHLGEDDAQFQKLYRTEDGQLYANIYLHVPFKSLKLDILVAL
jgi:hypothetical protein